MARAKKSVREVVEKNYPEFAEELTGATTEQLNNRLATLAKGLEESEQAKENDGELEKTRLLASELSAPYRDIKKAVQLKSKYVIGLLRDKGAA
jgi:hypothetical protein